MITSVIGKMFLEAYNKKFNTQYDAKTFFVEEYYPLFFDHNKYMMTAGNSPLENPKLSWEKMIRGQIPFESSEKRKDRFDKLINKIEVTEPDASIAIGYPSLDVLATTSSQVSNINFNTPKEDIYFSWIGSGLGVGVQGGMSILFNNTQVLLDIFEGWKLYRELLNKTPNLRGNQINTWNGQWIAHRYGRNFISQTPMVGFNPFSTKDGLISVDTQSWTKILIGISRKFQYPQMMGYVYNYGQTNTTVGFIPFVLTQIRKAIELYEKFFGMNDGERAEALYGTAFGFIKACQSGVIGIKAMEPKGIKDYIDKAKMPKYKEKENEDQVINFNIYIIWILAMLNNEDLWEKAQEFAQELYTYTQGAQQAKKDRTNQINSVLASTKKQVFIENLVEIISKVENGNKITEIASIVNTMPSDNVPYFLTLIRFHYAAISK